MSNRSNEAFYRSSEIRLRACIQSFNEDLL
jgi:hypothetical protein